MKILKRKEKERFSKHIIQCLTRKINEFWKSSAGFQKRVWLFGINGRNNLRQAIKLIYNKPSKHPLRTDFSEILQARFDSLHKLA
jgi:hypothetical protein